MELKLKGHMTSDEIKAMLNEKYSDSDQCLIAFEVNQGTGSTSGRRIDALAMHLWPSKDYKIIGFEIKVSRADWLNEMKQPEKSLAISQFCDEFYLVAPYGVLGIDELPKTWGYIQTTDDKLFTKIRAPKREPVSLDRPFMASFVRSLTRKYSDKKLLTAQIEKVKQQMTKEFDDKNESRIKRLEEENYRLQQIITDFNKETGLTMSKWNFGSIVDAVNALKNVHNRAKYISELQNKIACLDSMLKHDQLSVEALKNLKLE